MSKKSIVIKTYKSFILGYCACGCGESINIIRDKRFLRRYIKNHDKVGNSKQLGNKHWNWKGGRQKNRNYWYLYIPDYFNVTKKGTVLEHVYFFQEKNKCCLLEWGVVHHIDENPEHNMPWNLQGMTNKQHQLLHAFIDMDDRVCVRCNSSKTYVKKNGRPMWYKIGADCLCKNCYDKDPNVRNLKNKRRRDSYRKNKGVTIN